MAVARVKVVSDGEVEVKKETKLYEYAFSYKHRLDDDLLGDLDLTLVAQVQSFAPDEAKPKKRKRSQSLVTVDEQVDTALAYALNNAVVPTEGEALPSDDVAEALYVALVASSFSNNQLKLTRFYREAWSWEVFERVSLDSRILRGSLRYATHTRTWLYPLVTFFTRPSSPRVMPPRYSATVESTHDHVVAYSSEHELACVRLKVSDVLGCEYSVEPNEPLCDVVAYIMTLVVGTVLIECVADSEFIASFWRMRRYDQEYKLLDLLSDKFKQLCRSVSLGEVTGVPAFSFGSFDEVLAKHLEDGVTLIKPHERNYVMAFLYTWYAMQTLPQATRTNSLYNSEMGIVNTLAQWCAKQLNKASMQGVDTLRMSFTSMYELFKTQLKLSLERLPHVYKHETYLYSSCKILEYIERENKGKFVALDEYIDASSSLIRAILLDTVRASLMGDSERLLELIQEKLPTIWFQSFLAICNKDMLLESQTVSEVIGCIRNAKALREDEITKLFEIHHHARMARMGMADRFKPPEATPTLSYIDHRFAKYLPTMGESLSRYSEHTRLAFLSPTACPWFIDEFSTIIREYYVHDNYDYVLRQVSQLTERYVSVEVMPVVTTYVTDVLTDVKSKLFLGASDYFADSKYIDRLQVRLEGDQVTNVLPNVDVEYHDWVLAVTCALRRDVIRYQRGEFHDAFYEAVKYCVKFPRRSLTTYGKTITLEPDAELTTALFKGVAPKLTWSRAQIARAMANIDKYRSNQDGEAYTLELLVELAQMTYEGWKAWKAKLANVS